MAELSIAGLRAGYAKPDILTDITLRLRAGQLHAVLGPNGTGKTTLLRAIAGLLPLRAGSITWDDDGNRTELNKLTPRARAAYVAYVPQVAGNDIPLTVREAVEIAGRSALDTRRGGPQGPPAGRPGGRPLLESLLASLNLTAQADTQCSALSGGLWRRVLLAQGLAQRAPILLLDEPTAFLDPPARHDTLALLRQLAESIGLCVICVLHDPPLALQYAHTATAICDGQVLASGPATQVITPITLRLLYGAEVPTSPVSPEEVFHAR